MPATPPLSATIPNLAALVQRHQALIAQQRNAFTLRMHRALSWLQRAEAAGTDDDVAFVCLWIAFNAAYAQDLGSRVDNASERQTFRNFVDQVCQLDAEKSLSQLVWQVFPGPIRVLLNNHYVFQPFWDAHSNPRSDGSIPDHWREAFDDARQRVHRALAQQDTERVLYEVFVRLYTLRNQLMVCVRQTHLEARNRPEQDRVHTTFRGHDAQRLSNPALCSTPYAPHLHPAIQDPVGGRVHAAGCLHRSTGAPAWHECQRAAPLVQGIPPRTSPPEPCRNRARRATPDHTGLHAHRTQCRTPLMRR